MLQTGITWFQSLGYCQQLIHRSTNAEFVDDWVRPWKPVEQTFTLPRKERSTAAPSPVHQNTWETRFCKRQFNVTHRKCETGHELSVTKRHKIHWMVKSIHTPKSASASVSNYNIVSMVMLTLARGTGTGFPLLSHQIPCFSLTFPWFPKIFPWFFLSFHQDILVKKNIHVALVTLVYANIASLSAISS